VLVRARKDARGPLRLFPGLALHAEGGGFCSWVEEVLREGKALPLDAGEQDD
jgi:hypothetical protein